MFIQPPAHVPLRAVAAAVQAVVGPVPNPCAVYLPDDLSNLGRGLGREQLLDLCMWARTAIDALRLGEGCEDHAGVLTEVANLSMLFCERGLGAEYKPLTRQAQEALLSIKARVTRREREREERRARGEAVDERPIPWVGSGPELVVLTDVVELHEQQLDHEDFNQALLLWALQEFSWRRDQGNVLEAQ
jgi:hypothetical protein